jgi:predicted negative regulator of RcsB-dependent stress response
MSRNVLTLIVAILGIAVVAIGYQFYQERQKTTGVEISIGDRGISIEKK